MASSLQYLGSKISLITESEIRYEGILYTIDTKDSTCALSKVRSFGTEDRPTDRPVAPRDEVFEFIIFKGTDVKDIRICQPPKPQPTLKGGLPDDPAIVQHSVHSCTKRGSNLKNFSHTKSIYFHVKMCIQDSEMHCKCHFPTAFLNARSTFWQ